MNAPSRFDDLLRLWRDGEASAEELAELEGLLRGDARYRRSLARSLRLEVDLYSRYAASRGAAPPAPRWRLEAVAAVLAVGVSLLAAGAFLLRPEVFPVGRSIEAAGSARLRLQDGPDILLDPGSSGAYVSPGVFELRRGGASVDAGSALRLLTPSGAVSGSGFSARVDLPGLRVAVGQGRVEVDYDGLRHPLEKGESVLYLPVTERKASDLREAERRVREAKLVLAEAIDKALKKTPGTAVGASLDREDGRIEFTVHVVREGKLRELTLDARGAVIDDDGESDDRNAFVAAARIPLREALDAALAKVPGAALEADGELRDGRPRAEVEILSGGRLYEVSVCLETGAILSVGPATP